MANTEGVNIVISSDNSQALKAIEQLVNAINGIHDSNVKITADSSQAVDAAGKASNAMESINDAHAEITADSSQAVDAAARKGKGDLLKETGRDNIGDAWEITETADTLIFLNRETMTAAGRLLRVNRMLT